MPTRTRKHHALHKASSFYARFFLACLNVQHNNLLIQAAVVIDAHFACVGKQQHVTGCAKIIVMPKRIQFNIVLIAVLTCVNFPSTQMSVR